MSRQPILCLDFDGVLHSYSSGWQGAGIVGDPPVPGMVEFLDQVVRRFRVAVFSSRTLEPGGLDAMRGWLLFHLHLSMPAADAQHVYDLIEWPTAKPPAVVTLDDRAITFDGTWPDLDALAAFKPWNKRPDADRQLDALVYGNEQARIQRLEAALRWYADRTNYVHRSWLESSSNPAAVIGDMGHRAREALKED